MVEAVPKLLPDQTSSPDKSPRDLYVQDHLPLLEIARRFVGVPSFSYANLRRIHRKENWKEQRERHERKRNERMDARAVESEAERKERHAVKARRLSTAAERVLGHLERVLDRVPEDITLNIGTSNALADALSKVSMTVERAVRLENDVAPGARDPFVDVWAAAEESWQQEDAERSVARSAALKRAGKLVEALAARKEQDDSPSTPRRGGPLPDPPPPKPREPRRRLPRKLPGY